MKLQFLLDDFKTWVDCDSAEQTEAFLRLCLKNTNLKNVDEVIAKLKQGKMLRNGPTFCRQKPERRSK